MILPCCLTVAALLATTLCSIVSAQADVQEVGPRLHRQGHRRQGSLRSPSIEGKVLLIVNTASQCGLTPQYKGLEEIYQKYKDQGFEVLAFPANEFGSQEPGTDVQIKEFCSTKYKVSFPLFSKIVVKGKGIHPLYEYLTSEKTDPKFAGPIGWNFAKFLVNRKGEVIARFEPGTKPESADVTGAIEKALAEK